MITKIQECRDRSAEPMHARGAGLASVEGTDQRSDAESNFLLAIAQELANLYGGAIQEHEGTAQRVLEGAFRDLELGAHVARRPRVIQAA